MITKELILYIKRCRKMGFSDWQIKQALKERGWPEKEIKKAMARSFLKKNLPKWVFILIAIIAVAVISFTAWQAIAMLTEIHQIGQEIAEIGKDYPKVERQELIPLEEEFCGWATEGECSDDGDCIVGGCSNQVCQSKNEEPVVTTCEYVDCYNAEIHGVECKCVDNKCQWEQ